MTTVDKTLTVLFWVVVSSVISGLIAFFAKNPTVFNPLTVGIINIALVAIKNFIDPNVKNA